MLKTLAVIAVLFLQAPEPASGQASDNHVGSREAMQKTSQSPQNPFPPPSSREQTSEIQINQYTGNSIGDADAEKPIRISKPVSVSVDRSWQDDLALFFNGLLLVVGFLGVRSAVKTLKVINRQTDIMKKQNDLTMNERRARIGTDVQPTQLTAESEGSELRHLIATLNVRNIGVSRAYIRRTQGELITRRPNDAPREPEYCGLDLPDQFVDPSSVATPVKIYFIPDKITIRAFAEGLERATFSLHLVGFIEYETLGLCWRRDFAYDWMPTPSGLFDEGDEIDVVDNSSVSDKGRICYGYWQANQEQNKPEYPISCKLSEEITN